MNIHKQRSPRHLVVALAAMLGASGAVAQGTWDGGGADSNFSTAANWVGDVAPTTNGLYTFAGTTRLNPNNNITLTAADNTITFDSTAGAFTLGGNAIRMGGVNNNSSNLQTISVNLRLNGTRTINTGAAGVRVTSTITSTGTGARTVTKSGSGDLVLAFTGSYNLMAYNVTDGRLVTDNAGNTTLTQAAATTLATGTQLRLAQAGIANFSGGISGAGSVVKTGSGNSTLSGVNNYSGGTVVENGVLSYASSFTMSGANSLSLAGATNPAAGTDFGQITANTGTFTYGGSLTLNFTGVAVNNATYNLFELTGATQAGTFTSVAIAGSYTASLANSSGVWSAESSGYLFSFTESTGDLVITSAIPEASSFAAFAGLAGIAAVGLRRRRRA